MRFVLLALAGLLAGCAADATEPAPPAERAPSTGDPTRHTEVHQHTFPVTKSDEEWKKELSAEEYRILRKAGTEPAFTGKNWNNKASGVYQCAGCGQELFHSEHKFESGTGWPSYWRPVSGDAIVTDTDNYLIYTRTEVLCSRCGGHLGHVFRDGPEPTGLRYCINGNAMDFVPASTQE